MAVCDGVQGEAGVFQVGFQGSQGGFEDSGGGCRVQEG